MSIGLYDADMMTYTLVPFNLEIMKLSAYYKRKRDIVLFSKQIEPDRYSKFYYCKDYNDFNFPNFNKFNKSKDLFMDSSLLCLFEL